MMFETLVITLARAAALVCVLSTAFNAVVMVDTMSEELSRTVDPAPILLAIAVNSASEAEPKDTPVAPEIKEAACIIEFST